MGRGRSSARPEPEHGSQAAGVWASETVRLDKWLWAARFFKTRAIAQEAIEKGRVLVGDERVKVARSLRVGERVNVRIADAERVVEVLALSEQRGPAPVAQALYRETDASIAAREAQREQRRFMSEPAATITGRPTKRERRRLDGTGRDD